MSEQYFPRGGKIKRKATDSGGDKNDEDKLFEDQPTKRAKGEKKVKQKKLKNVDEHYKDDTEDNVTHVDPLKQDDLETQMVLLGRVKEVGELRLLVSLPCHLVGVVPVTGVSSTYSQRIAQQRDDDPAPSLSELFAAGQHVSCLVTGVDQSGHKVRNTLSVRPEDVNGALPAAALGPGLVLQCSVRSEEDNAFDMDCGVAGTCAVLPKSALGADPPPLVTGQVLWCLVDAVRALDGRVTVTLSADPGRLNGAAPGPQCSLTRQTLLPGMRLPVTVDKVLSGGLRLRLPAGLTGLVYKTQLEEAADCADDYNAGGAAHARVLYTLPVVRRVYLSLRPSVARLPVTAPPVGPPPAGRLPARLLDADRHGLRLALDDGAVAFAPVWHARRAGTRGEPARCTLLAYDAMDEVYIASMKGGREAPRPPVSPSVGDRVTCRVLELTEAGCRVELDGGATGLVPPHHLTNVPVSNPAAMFPAGKRLKCKVIQWEPQRRRLLLTHNARLVNTVLSLAADADQLKRGTTHYWVVTKVTERGLIMTGYSDLSGFVPVAFLGSALEDHFPGQILQCAVHKVRPAAAEAEEGRARVTLCPAAGAGWRGCRHVARVTGRAADRLLVVTEDGRRAELPARHLTDAPQHAAAALNTYNTGDQIEVVGLAALGKKLIVSAKPLFLEYVKSQRYPRSPAEVVSGLRLPGSVVAADERGVVVAFPSQHPAGTYRVRLQGLSDGWQRQQLAALKGGLEHRTLMLRVLAPPDADSRFLRLSARIDPETDRGGAAYLARCLRELSGVVPARPAVGDQVTGRLESADGDGVTVRLPDGRRGLLEGGAAGRTAGDTVTAAVLSAAPDGTLRLAADQPTVLPADGQAGVSAGRRCAARVLSAPAGSYLYTALLLPPAPPCLIQLPARRGLNDLAPAPDASAPAIGETLSVTITSCEGGVLVGVPSDRGDVIGAGRKRAKRAGRPAKRVRPRDKHWKASAGRGTPRRRQTATAIRYSRFTLQDDA